MKKVLTLTTLSLLLSIILLPSCTEDEDIDNGFEYCSVGDLPNGSFMSFNEKGDIVDQAKVCGTSITYYDEDCQPIQTYEYQRVFQEEVFPIYIQLAWVTNGVQLKKIIPFEMERMPFFPCIVK